MKYLTAQDALNAEDRKFIDMDIPEWGGKVRIGTISGKARDRYELLALNPDGKFNNYNIRAHLVASCLYDESGKLLFSEKDIDKLGDKSCVVLDRIYTEALKLSQIGREAVEELAKNSQTDPSGATPSN